jgi:hypothetical protein
LPEIKFPHITISCKNFTASEGPYSPKYSNVMWERLSGENVGACLHVDAPLLMFVVSGCEAKYSRMGRGSS